MPGLNTLPSEILLRLLEVAAMESPRTLLSLSSTTPRLRQLFTTGIRSERLLRTSLVAYTSPYMAPAVALARLIMFYVRDEMSMWDERFCHDAQLEKVIEDALEGGESITKLATSWEGPEGSAMREASASRCRGVDWEKLPLGELKASYTVHRCILRSALTNESCDLPQLLAGLYASFVQGIAGGLALNINPMQGAYTARRVWNWTCDALGVDSTGDVTAVKKELRLLEDIAATMTRSFQLPMEVTPPFRHGNVSIYIPRR